MKQGYPVCACNDGYLPDQATGLHCVSIYHTNRDAARRSQVLDRELRLQQRATQREIVQEARLALQNHPDYPTLRRKRRLGLAGTITGAVGMGIGGMLLMTLGTVDRELLVAGSVTAGIGFVVFLPSIITASSARRSINVIYRQELEKQKRRFSLALTGINPIISPDGKAAGIGATFRF